MVGRGADLSGWVGMVTRPCSVGELIATFLIIIGPCLFFYMLGVDAIGDAIHGFVAILACYFCWSKPRV